MNTGTLERKINFSSVTVDTLVQCMNFEYTVLVSQYSLYQKIDKLKGLASSLKLKSTDDFQPTKSPASHLNVLKVTALFTVLV